VTGQKSATGEILSRLATALLVAVCIAVVTGIACAFATKGITRTGAFFSLGSGLIAGCLAFLFTRDPNRPAPNAWDILMLSVFGIASFRAFAWLIYAVGDSLRILSPNNLGDLSLHLHFIRYLAAGAPFWPESPILSGTPLIYPLGADFFNSLLSLAGLPVERGLVWTGLIGATLSAWALWRWGGAFAIAALLFNGGLLGFAVFQSGQVQDFQSDAAWKNLFLTMLVPQRGMLFALPAGLLLLRSWREDFFGNGSGVPRIAQFLLYVSMPFFSVHTFLFLSLVLASIFLFQPSSRWRLLVFVLAAVPLATLGVWLVTGGFSAASGLRWQPGWMQGEDGWKFWVLNFGVLLPIAPVLFWKAIVRGTSQTRAFGSVCFVVFAMCCFVSFAPWEWDNTKLLIWAWLVAAPLIWSEVLKPLPSIPRACLCVLLFFSGAVSLVGGLDRRHGYDLASRSELAASAIAFKDVPPLDRIAIDPQFNHPAILLGRPVVCGYEGHLWSHGLDYREKFTKLRLVIDQAPDWMETAQEIGAKWVLPKGRTTPVKVSE
jgi:hypothetical protein